MIGAVAASILIVASHWQSVGAAPGDGASVAFRRSDARQRHDDARLKELGIAAFESPRLKLYTDLPASRVRSLPAVIEAAYAAWTEYFGPLPPTREGTDFQITGFLMADRELFRRTGLLPADLPSFLHGRHRDFEFWANAQDADYYLRHLVIHECTHCFMTAVPDVRIPYWYLEGMAELFATHRIDAGGRYEFRVMPDRPDRFEGLRRIPLIRTEVAQHRWKSLEDMQRLHPQDFETNIGYAWSWALCKFLDAHPRYQARFRELGKHTTDDDFSATTRRLFSPDLADLRTEWSLFSHQLQWGHDIPRAAIEFAAGTPLRRGDPVRSVAVAADRGWQSTRVLVQQSSEYNLVATGEVTLANVPKPWVSQPQGVSIVYSEGRPIGTLLAAIRRESSPDSLSESDDESMLKDIVIGRGATFVAPTTGTLYLRVNDLWGSLADNSGAYRVEIRAAETASP